MTDPRLFWKVEGMSENAFCLVVCKPSEEPVRHDLTGDAATIGRSPENTIQVLVAEVSVNHARLECEGGAYRLVDPGSTNGTKVNGNPVGPEGVALSDKDQIVFGTVVPAYFATTASIGEQPLAEWFASLGSAAPAAAAPAPAAPAASGAAPIRAAIPVSAPKPAPASAGGATVKLDQVRSAPAPAQPVAPKAAPGAPKAAPAPPKAAPGAPKAAPLKPPGAVPVKPAGAVPVKPPGAVPVKPAGAVPVKPPGAVPVKPVAAPPAGGGTPAAPRPVPLKRPEPGGAKPPAPKLPPKPGQ